MCGGELFDITIMWGELSGGCPYPRDLTTLFSVPEGGTVNIVLRYFPFLRHLTFTRGLGVGVKVASAKSNMLL